MAKESYKIPDTLDKSVGDMEINLRSSDGVGLKPMPIKILLAWIISILGLFYICTKSFIGAGGVWTVLFAILWIILTVLLLMRDKTGIPQASLVVSMLNYLPKNMRYLITRNNARANEFMRLTGIEGISPETGFIKFLDGSCGYMYMVVGSGSVLLFDEDRTAIIDRVDSFYRRMKTDYELIFITAKEPQKVDHQIMNLKKRYDRNTDPDLLAIADEDFKVLRDVVGGSFRSIHQYLIIKADNEEALTVGKNMLMSECENSQLMFKRCVALFDDDIYTVFRDVYRGKESV